MTPADFHATRQALGLTQAQLAEAIGISPRMLRYYESGDRKIPLTVALAVKAYAQLPKEEMK